MSLQESNLDKLQRMMADRLRADSFFADIAILEERKGVTSDDVLTALSTMNERNGKLGACVMVRMAMREARSPDLPSPEHRVTLPVAVFETPLFNRAEPQGTLKTADLISQHVERVLHGFQAHDLSASLHTEGTIPDNYQDGTLELVVNFSTQTFGQYLPVVSMPRIEVSAGEATLTSNTAGASIYYTLDGSYPGTDASLYSVPFSVNAGQTVRAVAYKANHTASSLNALTI